MRLDPHSLAKQVSAETGLEFNATETFSDGSRQQLELYPEGYPSSQTFKLRVSMSWRRIDLHIQPGHFAGDLVEAMGSSDRTGQQAFRAILNACLEDGAEVVLAINGASHHIEDEAIWQTPWRNMSLVINKGMLAINEGDSTEDMRQIKIWTSRAAAAVIAILPVETVSENPVVEPPNLAGLPEGARTRIEVNRYERDPRNRTAALAIHGHACLACGLDMGKRYGVAASGFIEVHHLTPVSEMGEGHIVDPKTDLVPLCPNCHSVVHRRNPPYSVEELRRMLQEV